MLRWPSLFRLGRYELLCPIASGGMAEVYAARIRGEGGFEKLVAIKCMLPHLARDREFVAMFLDEGRIVANIASPHVVQTYDLDRPNGTLCIAMELVIGASLREILVATRKTEAMPLPILVEILAQAAEGLHDVHRAVSSNGQPLHIVHRDVSPHNILIGADGRARISDFGVARAMSRLTTTHGGHLKGKWSYFSPEQARGEELDGRSDIFSLGIVAWEMATRKRLFWRKKSYDMAMLRAVQHAPIAPLEYFGLPLGFAKVVARALKRNKTERYSSAIEMANDLRECAWEFASELPGNDEIGAYVRKTCAPAIEKLESSIRDGIAGTGRFDWGSLPVQPPITADLPRPAPKRKWWPIAAVAAIATAAIAGMSMRPAPALPPPAVPKLETAIAPAPPPTVELVEAPDAPKEAVKPKAKRKRARRAEKPIAEKPIVEKPIAEKPIVEKIEAKPESSPSRENGLFGVDSFDRELAKKKK